MRFSIPLIEALDSRSHFSATVPAARTVIGPSTGLVAAAVPPSVSMVTQPATTANARRDLTIVTALTLPNGAINFSKLYRDAFRIYQVDANGARIGGAIPTGNLQTSGGGDTLSITPTNPLAANTTYRIEINQSYVANSLKVRDIAGNYLTPFTYTFTTGTEIAIADPSINFSQTSVANGSEAGAYSAVTMGPDGKLYAATLDGYIYRWNVANDGTLNGRQTITTVLDNNTSSDNTAGNRVITGITFDPNATGSSLKLWVSHGQYKFGSTAGTGTGPQYQADNYTGKVSVLSGANLQSYNDVIIGIPRSVKDHMNNQISFDRAGSNFYFVIPSMNAMGKADTTWGGRDENLLSGAMIKVNLAKLNTELQNGPIDLTNATYDATNTANALNVYATGIRNAYDMVFHSNGQLYSGVNGSSAGGNTPGNGSTIPSLSNVPQTEEDVLLNVQQGAYYGHPNPSRGQYVLDGGNPTADIDPYEFAATTTSAPNALYPVGVQPDAAYQLPAYDIGKNVSPNGMIEYTGSAFDGALNGALLICRYNSGQDILAITPNSDGTISKSNVQARITGLTGLQNPLDITEDTSNGNLYVAQLDETNMTGSIMLMKPKERDPVATPSTQVSSRPSRIAGYVTPGDHIGVVQLATVTNTGTTTLEIDVKRTKISGRHRGNFGVLDLGLTNIRILPGESRTFQVLIALNKGETYIASTNLAFKVNQPGSPYLSFQLRGVALDSTASTSSVAALNAGDVHTASMPKLTSIFASEDASDPLKDLLG